jgi:hypothetical protein
MNFGQMPYDANKISLLSTNRGAAEKPLGCLNNASLKEHRNDQKGKNTCTIPWITLPLE